MTARRILIAGGPRTGKTTEGLALARGLGVGLRSTDELIPEGWSASSLIASKWMNAPGPWVIEGVAVVRALRKWMAAHHEDEPIPADLLLWRDVALRELTPGQQALAKGVSTVMRSIVPELRRRGLVIAGWKG